MAEPRLTASVPPPPTTLVVVARDLAWAEVLTTALEENGASVELTTPDEAVRTVLAVAPDAVVVADGPSATSAAVRESLGREPLLASIPIDDRDGEVETRAAAIVARAMRGPARAGIGLAPIEGSPEPCIVRALEGHAGLLSVRGRERVGGVLVGPAPRDEVAAFVERIRPLAQRGEKVRVSFLEASPALLRTPPRVPRARDGKSDFARVGVLSASGGTEDVVARLAARFAEAVPFEAGGTGVGRIRALAPDVIVADREVLDDPEAPALTALRSDPRLSWASVIALPSSALAEGLGDPELALIESAIDDAVAVDVQVAKLAARRDPFHVRLEALGPLRLLRAVAAAGEHTRVVVTFGAVRVDVEVADQMVIGVTARGAAGETAQGHPALATLVGLPSGRVRVEPFRGTRSLDVMASIDDALPVVLRERPRIRTSWAPREPERSRVEVAASDVLGWLGVARTPALTPPASLETLVTASDEKPADDPSAPIDVSALEGSLGDEAAAPAPSASDPTAPLSDVLEPAPPPPLPPPPPPGAIPSPTPVATVSAARRPTPTSMGGLVAVGLGVLALAAASYARWAEPARRGGTDATPPPPPASSVVAIDPPALEEAFDVASTEAEEDVAEEAAHEDAVAHAVLPPTPEGARPAVALDAATIEGMIIRGNMARQRGALDVAQRYYEDVVAADASNGRALVGLARVHELRGELPEAIAYARRMTLAHPDHPANIVLLADLLIAHDERAEARTILEELLHDYPRNESVRARLEALEP